MSRPLPLQNQFNAGQRRDESRSRMRQNSAWTLRDILIEFGAPARERGGWSNASPEISATPRFALGGLYTTFSATGGEVDKNLVLSDQGALYSFTGDSSALIGTAHVVAQNPVFHGGAPLDGTTAVYTGLVVIPDSTLAAAPKVYDGTTLQGMNGTPPQAKFATIFKDYTVLAHGKVSSVLYPNRIWFSPAGDPDCFGLAGATAWDTDYAWIDFNLPVRAIAATKNALLVYEDGYIARVRGSVPPPDEDMVRDDPWQRIGLLDPFSITTYQDVIYWCAPQGVFRSDGVYIDNLTLKGGMLSYWLNLVAQADDNYRFATGIHRNKLIIAVMDGATYVDGFMVDLETYAWTTQSNLVATSFWNGITGRADDLFFGQRGSFRVGSVTDMWTPATSTDGNGTAVAAVIETPFYELGRPGLKVVKSLYAGYGLFDPATSDPVIQVDMIDTPESTSYVTLGHLTENSEYDRRRIPIGGLHWGVGFKFTRENAGDFLGFDLSAEVHFQEENKVR